MRRLLTGLLFALAVTPAAAEDIVPRDMGSCHVGGLTGVTFETTPEVWQGAPIFRT